MHCRSTFVHYFSCHGWKDYRSDLNQAWKPLFYISSDDVSRHHITCSRGVQMSLCIPQFSSVKEEDYKWKPAQWMGCKLHLFHWPVAYHCRVTRLLFPLVRRGLFQLGWRVSGKLCSAEKVILCRAYFPIHHQSKEPESHLLLAGKVVLVVTYACKHLH